MHIRTRGFVSSTLKEIFFGGKRTYSSEMAPFSQAMSSPKKDIHIFLDREAKENTTSVHQRSNHMMSLVIPDSPGSRIIITHT